MPHEAHLRCGHRLDYEAGWLVPDPGEAVPCRRHGHCLVESSTSSGGEPVWRSRGRRSPSRTEVHDDLLVVLLETPSTTVHALRRRRSSLRMLVAAEADGLLTLDLMSGRVVARS